MADTTATSPAGRQEHDDASIRFYTSAEVLDVALGAYERGLAAAAINAGRSHWNDPGNVQTFRARRIASELESMRKRAEVRNIIRGRPEKFRYAGGPVDWDTGYPAMSACAWLRRHRSRGTYGLAGGGGR